MKGFRFDTVMFPINFVEYLRCGFGKDVPELAKQQGVAMLAIKAMSRRLAGGQGDAQVVVPVGRRARRGRHGHAVRAVPDRRGGRHPAVVPGPVEKAIKAAKRLKPIAPAELTRLGELAQSCSSIFQKDDSQASWHRPPRDPRVYRNPHEGCGGQWA